MPTFITLLAELGQNVSIILSFVFVYILLDNRIKNLDETFRGVISGVSFSIIALIAMQFPIEIQSGVLIDSRVVLTSFAGIYGGPISAIITGLTASAYRFSLGGIGAWPGVGAILTGALTGIIVNRKFKDRLEELNYRHFAIIGTCLTIEGITATSLIPLPFEVIVGILQDTGLAVFFIYTSSSLIIGFLFNIENERKRAEKAVRESEEKYRQLISTSTEAIMVFDATTREFIDVNKACENLYGYSREEFLCLKQNNISAEKEKSEDSIRIALNEGLAHIPLRYHKKKDGTIFPVEISVSKFRLGGKSVLGGFVTDITERKHAEEIQEELERRRENFVWMTNHELRTPLTVIMGHFEFYEKNINDIDRERQEKIFSAIKSNLGRLERLTDEVSLFAQLERDIFKIVKNNFNFCDFFQITKEQYQNLLGEQIEFHVCQENSPVIIEGDQNSLQKVFDNLISNAINQTHSDKRKIVINQEFLPGIFKITVTDNGAGIASENLEQIFGQFVSIETEYSVAGTGLGLHLCRQIIEAHGGTIIAKSEGIGKGSTFTIEIPIYTADI